MNPVEMGMPNGDSVVTAVQADPSFERTLLKVDST